MYEKIKKYVRALNRLTDKFGVMPEVSASKKKHLTALEDKINDGDSVALELWYTEYANLIIGG